MRGLILGALLACTPAEPDSSGSTTTDSTTEGDESNSESTTSDTTEDTGDDNWGIVLDVGPPSYGTEG